MELPGQFPDEALYNLDVWDERFWVKKALIKEAFRDLKSLRFTRLGMWGEDEFKEEERQLINRINMLSPASRGDNEQTYAASWAFLKMKGRG